MIGIWLKLNYLLYTFPYLFPISNIVITGVQLQNVQIGHLYLDTHAIARRLRDQ